MRRGPARLAALAAAGLLAAAAPAADPSDRPYASDASDSFFVGVREICAGGMRLAGSRANLAAEERVAGLFAASGLEHGEMPFDAPSFVPGETWLQPAAMPPVRIRPLHPGLLRPGNFATSSFDAVVVDLGRGTEADLAAAAGVPLDGAIVLLDFASGGNWQRLLRFGVKGFVFVGAADNPPGEGHQKFFTTEANVPRFYVGAGEGERLRAAAAAVPGRRLPVHVAAQPSRWEPRTLRNLWVLVPGSDPELGREIVLLYAPLDANGIVPDLAVGGQKAASLNLLLALLERFRQRPPARTVLLAAVNAHCQRFAGERVLAWNLLVPSETVEAARQPVVDDVRRQASLAGAYDGLTLDAARPAASQAAFDRLLAAADTTLGRSVALRDPLVARLRRAVLAGQAQRAAGGEAAAEHLLALCRETGRRAPLASLTPAEWELLGRTAADIAAENRRLQELNRRELEMSDTCRELFRVTAGRRIVFAVSLGLAWTRPQIAFGSGNYWGDQQWPVPFGRHAARIAAALPAARAGGTNLFFDALTNVGGLPQGYFFAANPDDVNVFNNAGVPAFALLTPFVAGGRAFSPDDTPERLDPAAVARTARFAGDCLAALLDDRAVTAAADLPAPKASRLWTTRLHTRRFDEFSADVLPSIPVPDTLIALHDWGSLQLSQDVTGAWLAMTDSRAAVTVVGLDKNTAWQPVFTQAYRLDAAGAAVTDMIDSGETHSRLSTDLRPARELYLTLFSCREYPVLDRVDSSLLGASAIANQRYLVLDGRANNVPRRYGTMGFVCPFSSKRWPTPEVNGPVSVCVEPGAVFKLLTDPGRRPLLGATADRPEGAGFGPGRPVPADCFAASADDMAALNASRLAALRGVSDELAARFLQDGSRRLAEAEACRASADHLGRLRALYAALGAEAKAYRQIADTRNDMLQAVVLYLALLLPFCFFLQRLLFRTQRVEAQMGIFLALFVAMYLLFRRIHPAFVVAREPEAMFIAFVMGALGLFVIGVLHGRFEGEMRLLFRAFDGGGAAAAIGASQAGQQALLIGVNNMRRRRIRTTLTTATIVLVTFTMLAFTSVSKRLRPTLVSKNASAPYSGLFFHWPGKTMDEPSLQVMKDLFHGRGDVLVRRWLLAPSYDTGEQRHVIPLRVRRSDGESTVHIEAALGLPAAEDGFLGRVPVEAGGRFFSADDAREVVLPASLAAALGFEAERLGGAGLDINGERYELVAVIRDERLQAMRDLDQASILPVKSMRRRPAEEGPEALVIEDDTESGVTRFEPSAVLVLPVETCRRLGGRPYSVSLRLRDGENVWPFARELLVASQARFYVGSRQPFRVEDPDAPAAAPGRQPRPVAPGVYYIGAGYRTAIGGLARLLIPLLIAATIVLNTMLGSVFERKREIAIYNAVGLNPTHIGLFFLAEAFVYSVLGAVGGYLIGQTLGALLKAGGLVAGVNLNFSSLSVVYVILFTVAVVLLSTIYPAVVATRAAVPSGKRTWSLPPHDGQRMQIVFPAIYRAEALAGVVAYLDAYFGRFAEAALADAVVTPASASDAGDAAGRPVCTRVYDMALAPYDLGVNQRLTLRGAWDESLGFCRIGLTIERTAGQDSNWAAVNRPFLDKLRRHLLNWRNLDAAAQQRYIAAAAAARPPP
jgi:hypothetical protein